MSQHLLPRNAQPLERALVDAIDPTDDLASSIDAIHGFKFDRPLRAGANYGPWLLAEYGLGEIERFFASIEDAIDAGIEWSRLRGTPDAIETALSWLGYAAADVKDQHANRYRWNRYQIAMGALPPADEVQGLFDAEFLADRSDPARSVFFRGYHGYDVRGLEYSRNKWGNTIWSDASGVRLPGGTVKWSHGRNHVGAIVADAGAQEALGVNVSNGQVLGWGEFPWTAPGVTWNGIVDAPAFKSYLLRQLPVLLGIYDAAGEAIGYRRPISVVDVTDSVIHDPDNCVLRITARTGFGDAAGQDVAHCAPVFRIAAAPGVKPGKLWFQPDEVAIEDGYDAADMTIGSFALGVTFKETVREHIELTVEI